MAGWDIPAGRLQYLERLWCLLPTSGRVWSRTLDQRFGRIDDLRASVIHMSKFLLTSYAQPEPGIYGLSLCDKTAHVGYIQCFKSRLEWP